MSFINNDKNIDAAYRNVKLVITALEEFIPIFNQSIYDPNRKSHLLTMSRNLATVYTKAINTNAKDATSVTLLILFKFNDTNNTVLDTINELTTTLSFDMLDSDMKMSETFVRTAQLQKNALLKLMSSTIVKLTYVNNTIDTLYTDSIDINDLIQQYTKYPNTIELFVELAKRVIDTSGISSDIVLLYLEIVKQRIFNIPSVAVNTSNAIAHTFEPLVTHAVNTNPHGLDSNYYLNMIQRYSKSASSGYIPLKELSKELHITINTIGGIDTIYGAGKSDATRIANIHKQISTIAKLKKINIIAIVRQTNVVYSTYKLYNATVNNKSGINSNIIADTNTITRHVASVDSISADSMTLHTTHGDMHDIIKQRKFNTVVKSDTLLLIDSIVIESIDGVNWRRLYIDKMHIAQLLTGPNLILPALNAEVENSILNYYVGPKDIKYTSVHTPIAHIRQTITAKTLEEFKRDLLSHKSYTIKHLDMFLNSDIIMELYIDTMFEMFDDYSSKRRISKIVEQESRLSFLSDLNNRGKRYKRELIAGYNNQRKDFKLLISTADGTQLHMKLYNLLETIIKYALSFIISEKDNVFNVIDEKQILFMS